MVVSIKLLRFTIRNKNYMTRREIVPLQKELKELVYKYGQAGHDKAGGPTVHYVRKSIADAAPNEEKLIECLEYFRKLDKQ